MARAKVRIRFRKGGDLRLVSHHDLMRCFERMLRRADLPFRSTEGFNPKPKMMFALSLALGIVGCQEVIEVEFDPELPAEEIHHRLERQAPAGLEILSVRWIDPKIKAQVRRVCYRLPLEVRTEPLTPDPSPLSGERGNYGELRERIAALLAAPQCFVERTHPQPRRLDLRPYIRELRLLEGALEIDLLVTPTGAARPEEVAELLGLGNLLKEGVVLERTTLEIIDEVQDTREELPVQPEVFCKG